MVPTTSSLSRQSPSLQESATRDRTKPAKILVSSIGDAAESSKHRSSTLNFGTAQKSPTFHPSPLNDVIKDAVISAATPQHFYTHSLPSNSNMRYSSERQYQTTTPPQANFPSSLPIIPPPDYQIASSIQFHSPDIQRPPLPKIPPPDYHSYATLPPVRRMKPPNDLLRSCSERATVNVPLRAPYTIDYRNSCVTVITISDSPPNTSVTAPSTATTSEHSENHSNHSPIEKEQAHSSCHPQQTMVGNVLNNMTHYYKKACIKSWLQESMTSLAARPSNSVATTPMIDYTRHSSTTTEQIPPARAANQTNIDTDIDSLKRLLDSPQRDHIKAWLQDLNYENYRRKKIDPAKLIAARERIQNIHDNKKYHDSLLWDANASCQYRQEARNFYKAAGVSIEEQRHAELHCMKSGEFYALSQLPIFPTRLMGAALKLNTFRSEHAAKSWMMARAGLHANIGGLLSPMWDALSTLAKHGRPIPADEYWNVPSRRHVVSKLKQCLEQSEQAFKICQESGRIVPGEIKEILEQARKLYKMVNAKGYCYSAPSTISSVFEFIKTTIDIVVSTATASFSEPVVRSATNACTALIYSFICPLEEVAAMDQIRMQNAKYANIFQEDGKTVDIEKVMGLWQGKRQTEAACIEKAVERHFEKYSYKIEHAKERLKFLNQALTMPNEQALKQLHQITACDAAISFLKTQIAALKPQVDKSAAQDTNWLLQLSRANIDESLLQSLSQAPLTSRSLLSNPITQRNASKQVCTDRLVSEQKKYTPSHTVAESQYSTAIGEVLQRLSYSESDETRAAHESQDNSHNITESSTTTNSLVSFLQHFSNGKYLLKALERDLSQLIEEKKEALYLDKLKRLIGDYQVFKNLKNLAQQQNAISDYSSLNLLDSAGLIATMLCSSAKLRIEAIKSEYAHPGAISSRVIERVPLSIALSTLMGLGVTPEYRFGEDATILDWLHHSPPEIFNVPQPALAAEYVGDAFISASIQELCRLQAHRLANIENYLRNLDFHNTAIPNTRNSLSQIAPSIILTEEHHLPNFSNFSAYTQFHRLARNHPESKTLRQEKIKNFALANLRTSTFGFRDLALRLFIDIKGLHLNKETKQLLDQIESHNQNVARQSPSVADRDEPIFFHPIMTGMTCTEFDAPQEPLTFIIPCTKINYGPINLSDYPNEGSQLESEA